MKASSKSFNLIFTLCLFNLEACRAVQVRWMIDQKSCSEGQADFLRAAIDGALQMANAGLQAVDQPIANWMFGQDRTPANILSVREWISNMFNTDIGIGTLGPALTGEVTAGYALGDNDIKFYCNRQRLKRRPKFPSEWYDEDIKAVVKGKDSTLCLWNTAAQTFLSNTNYIQVQLCPWFLDYATKQKYKFTTNLPRKIIAGATKAVAVPIIKKKYDIKPIDVISMFDKVVLHELTHARREEDNKKKIISTEDVAYGWTRCRRISTLTTGNIGQDNQVLGPEENADTYALFGSAAFIQSKGGFVTIDGNLTLGQ